MQVEFKTKDAYAERVSNQVSSARAQRAAAKAKLDKDIIDTVELSHKAPKKRPGLASQVDRVDLSTKMSIEDVNRLLKSEVGKKVKSLFEDAGIDPSSAADTDWSPEATADRIFSGSTGLLGVWRGQHPEMSEKELIESFEKVLRKSVNQGASEAIGLISSRGFEDEDSLVNTAEETIGLVHRKFDAYFADLQEKLAASEGEPLGTAISE